MAWFFLSRLVGAAVAVVSLVVLTWLLSADDFGRYSLVILSGTIGYYLTVSWLPMGVTRFNSSAEFAGGAQRMAQGMFLSGMVLALPVALFVAAMLSAAWREIFLLSFSVAYGSAVHEFGLACLRVQGRGPAFAVAAILRPVLALTLAVMVLLAGGGFQGAVVAFAAGAVVTGALAASWAAQRSGIGRPGRIALATFLRFGLPLAAVSGGSLLFPLTSQLLLASMVDLEQAGYFAAATALAERTMVMLMMTLRQANAATVFHAHEQGPPAALDLILSRHYALLLLIGAPVFALFFFAPHTITRVLFDDGFGAGVAQYLPAMAVAAFASGVAGSFLGFVFELRRQTLRELAVSSGLLLSHVMAVAASIAVLGGVGAAYGTVVTSALMVGAYGWSARGMVGWRVIVGPLGKILVALGAGAPFLAAADRIDSVPRAVACVALGVLVMLGVLRLLCYSSLGIIEAALLSHWRRASSR